MGEPARFDEVVELRELQSDLASLIDADPNRQISEAQAKTFAKVRAYRADYVEAVAKLRSARAYCVTDDDLRSAIDALRRFNAIEAELVNAKSQGVLGPLVDRAQAVAQARAYIYPPSEILLEAKSMVADMSDWGLPLAVLRGINDDLFPPLAARDLSTRRAALNKLMDFYDAWSEHVSEYERWAKRTAWALGALAFVAILGCIASVLTGQGLCGLMFGGLTGAVVSVLGKLPPMLGWGQWASYAPRMLGRLATGVAATLAGGALLSAGVLKIGTESMDDLLAQVSSRQVLYLLGLGILFGFSERALVRFRQLVFKPDTEVDVDDDDEDGR